MSNKISWTELTINPIQDKRKGKSGRGYHCTKCAPECLHCYAEGMNNRFGNRQPFDDTPVEFEIVWKVIDKLAKRRKPTTVFVESMGDLYHRDVTNVQIFSIYHALLKIPQHRYMFLTKRAKRMKVVSDRFCTLNALRELPGNWVGMVTAGTQATADKNIPPLLASKFQTRGVSCEPLLSGIDIRGILASGTLASIDAPYSSDDMLNSQYLDLVIVGGETGPGARPMHPAWPRSLRDQCAAAGVTFHFKSWGAWIPATDTDYDPSKPIEGVKSCWLDIRGGPKDRISTGYSAMMHDPAKMVRVGARAAGHLLDGVEHRGLPE